MKMSKYVGHSCILYHFKLLQRNWKKSCAALYFSHLCRTSRLQNLLCLLYFILCFCTLNIIITVILLSLHYISDEVFQHTNNTYLCMCKNNEVTSPFGVSSKSISQHYLLFIQVKTQQGSMVTIVYTKYYTS